VASEVECHILYLQIVFIYSPVILCENMNIKLMRMYILLRRRVSKYIYIAYNVYKYFSYIAYEIDSTINRRWADGKFYATCIHANKDKIV